jgi:hypothetical protein
MTIEVKAWCYYSILEKESERQDEKDKFLLAHDYNLLPPCFWFLFWLP